MCEPTYTVYVKRVSGMLVDHRCKSELTFSAEASELRICVAKPFAHRSSGDWPSA